MNRKQIGITTLAVCLMLSGPLAFAKPAGHGTGTGAGMPSGFGKGQKKGWQGGTKPPGWRIPRPLDPWGRDPHDTRSDCQVKTRAP